jgi:acyl carrier protein
VSSTTAVAPDLVQDLVAGIWCELTGVDTVHDDDNFFAFGGDSLTALQLVSRVKTATGAALSLKAFFDAATFGALVTLARTPSPADDPVVSTGASTGPLSPEQEAIRRAVERHPHDTSWNVVLCYEVPGPVDADVLRESLRVLVRRHEALRTTIAAEGGTPRLVVAGSDEFVFEVLDDPAESAPELAERLGDTPMALDRPLFDVHLVRSAGRNQLVFRYHLTIVDGHSVNLLNRELSTAYAALLAGRTAALPPVPFQYGDYARWQCRRIAEGRYDAAIGFWRERLAGARMTAVLADVASHDALASTPPTVVHLPFTPELTARLRHLARGLRATPYLVVATQLRALLAEAAGSDDIVFVTPVANRGTPGHDAVVGLFRNLVLVRTGPQRAGRVVDDVANVRAAAVAAYQFQDCPFSYVTDTLFPGEAAAGVPPWEVGIAMQQAPARDLRIGDVDAVQVDLALRGIKRPISVNVFESKSSMTCTFVYQPGVLRAPDAVAAIPELLVARLTETVG